MGGEKRQILHNIGNTPIVELNCDEIPGVQVFAKLEFLNPTGSVKDRAAKYIIETLLETGKIDSSSILVESTSGNFGIALSSYSKMYGLPFYCVIDPLISPINEQLIRLLSEKVFKVDKRDENGGYLLNRLRKINELLQSDSNIYWVNQYWNPLNAEAYYHSLGDEILAQMDNDLNYIFIGVSSGGTITGLSQKIKEKLPSCKVIAVDIEGSVVFGGIPAKRYIPGIGSSMVPPILQGAQIDEIVYVNEYSTIQYCKKLLRDYSIFAGGSSGSAMAAIHKYFSMEKLTDQKKAKVMTIFCDRGDRYASTIYNDVWVNNTYSDFLTHLSEKTQESLSGR
ncbi:putative siderophore biosynthesis protein SbnA [compost metagenome]